MNWIAALMLAAASAITHAQPDGPGTSAAESPDALVVRLSSGVIEAVRTDKSLQSGDPVALQRLVEERILPHADFEKTTRLAVGRSWRTATPEQRTRLTLEFRSLLIRTYAGALSVARDHKVRLLLFRPDSDTDVIVRTQAVPPRGEPIQLDYRLEKTADGWKIYDVGVAGIWLVQNYQTSFASEIGRGGVDGLIRTLAERNQQGARPKSS